jgi:type II secretory pathway pseudopilin PulG
MRKLRGNVFIDFLKDNLVALALFAVIAAVFVVGVNNASGSSAEEEKRVAEQSVRRAMISCYAIEGFYPASYEYLRDNYNVKIDEDKYIVDYEVFATNIMPQITIIEVKQ